MSDLRTLEAAAGRYVDPLLGRSLADAGVMLLATQAGDKPQLRLTLGFPAAGYVATLKAALKAHLAAELPATEAEIQVDWQIAPQSVQQGLAPLVGVKNIIAVASARAASANRR